MDEITNSIGMRLKKVPAGIFTMGSDNPDDENPRYEARILQDFYCGVCPVTQAQAQIVFELEPGYFEHPNRPLTYVNWHQAGEFCSRLSEREGRRYRLLKEIEWEYVCRAGTSTKFFWGEDESDAGLYAWYKENSEGRSHDVGEKRPNAWGFHDIVGNVECWCEDEYRDVSYCRDEYRIIRGGSFQSFPKALRCAFRSFWSKDRGDELLGLRVAADVSEVRAAGDDWFDNQVSALRRLAEKLRAWRNEDGPDALDALRTEARHIGEKMNERGGMKLMLRAHSVSKGGREIEIAWNGVGDWRG
ncbi:MAG: formylglycine-generating enzyme family protein [Candidatus Aminicenantes bacterium]|nr:formylglycine-generating enzyme family protein [Candidatus Aminicenantes bacterium]